MTFLWPFMLGSLFLIPILVWIYLRVQVRRRRAVQTYGNLGMLHTQSGRAPGFRRHLPPLLFLAAISLLLVGMARPQATIALPRQEGTVILAMDVSGSMAADDLTPTRMEAAKAAAVAFVSKQPLTVQIGVVAFSDSGFQVQQPTNDPSLVLAAIDRLTPQRGTSIANGITASLKAIAAGPALPPEIYSNLLLTPTPTPAPVPAGTVRSAGIILLSDGENNENPDPMVAAQAAADQGVRIYTVGIGSPAGTTVNINGFSIHTQLDESTLQGIANLTGGKYYDAQSAQDLLKIYDSLRSVVVVKPEKTELTSLFAGGGILLFLVGCIFSLFWFSHLP
jgi:Ca-activated chloride channel family protein